MTSDSNKKILATVTGASGLVGAAIAVEFLRRGHSVRLPLRKQEQIDAWVTEYGKQYPGQIEGVLLKGQIWEEGVFDEAVKGVDAVVHAASPADLQIKTDAETDILKPAVAGTLSLLESAKKVPSIKSVAVTSSGAAYASMNVYFTPQAGEKPFLSESTWNPLTYEEAAKMGAEKAMFVYSASKATAERAALDFANKPDVYFALSTHAPGFVLGRTYVPGPKTLRTAGSTLNYGVNFLWDQKDFSATAALPIDVFVSNEDLVRFMIKAQPALKPHLPPVPDQPTEDETPTALYEFDASRYEKDFGVQYSTAEEIAAQFAEQVYDLAKADGLL